MTAKKGYYPLMLDLSQFKCLVVGGGSVAIRKVKSLLAYGGKVTVLSENFNKEIVSLPVTCIQASFEEKYLANYRKGLSLVIAATNDKVCNEGIGLYCKRHQMLCNVVTDEVLSSFIVPSSLRREDLTIAVSTGGNSPGLAAKIQRELAGKYDEDFGKYVTRLGELRKIIKEEVQDEHKRRRLLKALLEMKQEALMTYVYKEEQ